MFQSKITVIGAGIGGLTAAIALKHHGLICEIFEEVPELKAAGAGIVLAPNAMTVYRKLGIDEEIVAYGNLLTEMRITDHLNRNIQKNDLIQYGAPAVAISRTALQEVLLRHIEKDTLYTGYELKSITKQNELFTLHFNNNKIHDTRLIIGADGIHSAVRRNLFSEITLRDSNQICWRGMVKTDPGDHCPACAIEMWGPGKRFGFVPIGQDTYYWFAPVNRDLVPEGISSKEELVELYSGFVPWVRTIIMETAEDTIIRNDILDFHPLRFWYRQGVVLMGDAAHATTPNMGQGACQAIEDAWVLAKLLSRTDIPEAAFYRYKGLRKPVTDYVTNTSYTFGKMAQWENKPAIKLRNFILGKIPAKFMSDRLARLYRVKY